MKRKSAGLVKKQAYNPESKRKYYVKNRLALLEKGRAAYFANKEKKRAYDARRRQEKRHLYREASKRFRENNPGLKNADTQLRRAVLRGAYPAWANSFFIREIYELAALRTKALGQKFVVDHIVPLRGKKVCGLHVENNLQIIPEWMNAAKGNRYII